jgi:hypothetical protein
MIVNRMRHRHTCARFYLPLILTVCLGAAAGARSDSRTAPVSPAIVIGFVGGYVSHDNPVHAEVQLAADLRAEYPSGVDVEAFENHRGEQAYQRILELVDANHDGSLSPEEKQQARIILYGHSWGAAESVYVARELDKEGIPVLLTIQVDSISKYRHNDSIIPANVRQAVNFYQPHGLIRGERQIRAADPARTRILGNFLVDYKSHPISCKSYPWWDRYLARSHTEIECDPALWNQIASLIRSQLQPAADPVASSIAK